jgi:hypothetical protein
MDRKPVSGLRSRAQNLVAIALGRMSRSCINRAQFMITNRNHKVDSCLEGHHVAAPQENWQVA